MGTSRAARAPSSRRWNTVIGALKAPERNANTVVNLAFSVAVNTLPTIIPVSAPIAFGASEGIRFALDVRDKGLEAAAKRGAIRVAERYVVPSISNELWTLASSKMDPKLSESPFGRLAEVAFKKTMNQIMSKGAKALIEQEK